MSTHTDFKPLPSPHKDSKQEPLKPKPRKITGNKAEIDAFLDKFDVSFSRSMKPCANQG